MLASEPPARPSGLQRRDVFRLGLAGMAANLALPLGARDFGQGFTHGIASGEPGPDRVLLWTRYRAPQDATLRFELSDGLDFARIVAGGEALASAQSDWCAKGWATGLTPGRWYYYRFIAPDGTVSETGRTRTLPEGPVARWKMAVFSCSNLGFGWFNAYAHAAESNEFDLALHLGDYFYEYPRGTYPSAGQAHPERPIWPESEIVALADYRLRHATYRADPDLRRLTQLYPLIAVPDDHESANDSWEGGAENHQPETEGPWSVRKAAAMRAYREWLPLSDEPWAAYEVGDLATLFRLETRLTARSQPHDVAAVIQRAGSGEGAVAAALKAFREGAWRDPSHTLLGATQERWLAEGLKRSRSSGRSWQVLVQQVIMGKLAMAPGVAQGLGDDVPDWLRNLVARRAAMRDAGLPANMDAWDGYPAARERLLAAAQSADARLVSLAGDSHNAWAFNLDHGGAPAGIEFAGHSVTSPGLENSVRWIDPARMARDTVAANPQLVWAETARRGYVALELAGETATAEYRFLDTVRQRGTDLSGTARLTADARRLQITPA